jgi:hypothetical protein
LCKNYILLKEDSAVTIVHARGAEAYHAQKHNLYQRAVIFEHDEKVVAREPWKEK